VCVIYKRQQQGGLGHNCNATLEKEQ
jgi:hypothetical protein